MTGRGAFPLRRNQSFIHAIPPKKYINICKGAKKSSSGCSYYQSDPISNYVIYHGIPPQNLHVFRGLYGLFFGGPNLYFSWFCASHGICIYSKYIYIYCIYTYIYNIYIYITVYSPTIVVSGPPCPASLSPAFVARPSTEDQIRSKGWGSRQV